MNLKSHIKESFREPWKSCDFTSGGVCRAGGRSRLAPPPEEEMEEMDIDAEDSDGGNGQENEAEALDIMPTEEQADFHRPPNASR